MKVRRPSIRLRIHERGDERLDAFLDLIAAASRLRSLEDTLGVLVRRIAELIHAPVCSVYLYEPDEDALVLLANVGFPPGVLGQVRLRPGEGITGFAVECLRPVSVAAAARDPRNKPVPGLGEERYPAFLAVPLLGEGAAVGALVVQRAGRAFTPAEVTLVAALAAPVVHAVSLARARAAAGAEDHAGTVRLSGEPAGAPELVLGTLALGRPRGAAGASRSPGDPVGLEPDQAGAAVRRAFDATMAELLPLARPFPTLATLLDDRRLLERTLELVHSGTEPTRALDRVARESARIAARSGEPTLRRRAVDLEALCERAAARLGGPATGTVAPGTVLLAHRLSSWEALEVAQGGGIGVALAGPADDSPGLALCQALGLAGCAAIGGLFRWARPGARALLDGGAGTLVLNPGHSEVAGYRLRAHERRGRSARREA